MAMLSGRHSASVVVDKYLLCVNLGGVATILKIEKKPFAVDT